MNFSNKKYNKNIVQSFKLLFSENKSNLTLRFPDEETKVKMYSHLEAIQLNRQCGGEKSKLFEFLMERDVVKKKVVHIKFCHLFKSFW